MPTHDFRVPVLPGTLRISVIADGDTYVTDLPATKLGRVCKAIMLWVDLRKAYYILSF